LEITQHYEKEFFDDLKQLNCDKPSIVLRVTNHVPEVVNFIQKLIDSNQAYSVPSGSVYFNTQKFNIKSFHSLQEAESEFDSKGK
jgi:cysteinyl-tRNA synthetase